MKPSKPSPPAIPAFTFSGRVRLEVQGTHGAYRFVPKDTQHLGSLLAKNAMLYVLPQVLVQKSAKSRRLVAKVCPSPLRVSRGWLSGQIEATDPSDLRLINAVLGTALQADGAVGMAHGRGTYLPPEDLGDEYITAGKVLYVSWSDALLLIPDLYAHEEDPYST